MTVIDINSNRQFSENSVINVILPFVASFIFFFATMSASGYMLQAVADEKENRTLEIMITSLTPGQLIGGKLAGLLSAALTQLLIYLLAAVICVQVAAPTIEALQQAEMPWTYLGVMVLFFLPTYVLIASIMVAIGGSVDELQQGQQIAGILNLIFISPVFLTMLLFENPSSPLDFIHDLLSPHGLPDHFIALGLELDPDLADRAELGAPGCLDRRKHVGGSPYFPGGYAALWPAAEYPLDVGRHSREPWEVAMRNIGLVAKYTFLTTVRTRSFWVITLLVPAFLLVFQVYSALQEGEISRDMGAEEAETAQDQAPSGLPVLGLVDEAGLLKNMPEGFPQTLFTRFTDLEAARAALKSGQIDQLIHLPASYLADGAVIVYDRDFQVTSGGTDAGLGFGSQDEWILPYLINYNLTGDVMLSSALRNPTPGILARYHALQPPAPVDEGARTTAVLVGRIMPYIFYFILLFSSSYLLRSVSAEKENRTAEVLLLSVEPREFMMGKVLRAGGGDPDPVLVLDRQRVFCFTARRDRPGDCYPGAHPDFPFLVGDVPAFWLPGFWWDHGSRRGVGPQCPRGQPAHLDFNPATVADAAVCIRLC